MISYTNPSRVEALGQCVRTRREALGLRQAELGELAGCSSRFVHTLETGKDTVRMDKVLDVLEVLGLDLQVVPGTGRTVSADLADTEADRAP
ncbi:helix-turn-helix transcriptional regulator [Gaopeijia maritima]|uniref:helix-turn-helix transcriptional regulator n=1 Tax=Gaopeijia maritima TaxID=3119007 RepID=UPI00324B0B26